MKKLGVPQLKKTLPNPVFKERLQEFLRHCNTRNSECVSTNSPSKTASRRSSQTAQRILNLHLDLVKPETKNPTKKTLLKSQSNRLLQRSDKNGRSIVYQKTPILQKHKEFRVFELTNLMRKPRVETVISRYSSHKKF